MTRNKSIRCLLDLTRKPGNQSDKLTLGRKLQRRLKGDPIRGHEGPEVLEQLKGGGGAKSYEEGRGLGVIRGGGEGQDCPHNWLGSVQGFLWRIKGRKGNLRRNGGFFQLFMNLGSAEAWGGIRGSLYLLPVGVPQNVAAHDVDDVWLWVHFAHQTAQPLPEAVGVGASHRWPPIRATSCEEGWARA